MPWARTAETFGFSPPDAAVPPWLPQPAWFADYAADQQAADPQSFLGLNRRAVSVRRELWTALVAPLTWLATGHPDAIAFARGPAVCVVNFGALPFAVPAAWGDLRLSSITTPPGTVAADCTVWLE
jgi:alpha-glucosidase